MLFVTHDRRFLENCASRILELAPSYPEGAFEVKGNYTDLCDAKKRFYCHRKQSRQLFQTKYAETQRGLDRVYRVGKLETRPKYRMPLHDEPS